MAAWRARGLEHGPHLLTCRQAEYTVGLVAGALAKDEPDGLPSAGLAGICDGLLEASVPAGFKDASTSLAVDWTDLDSFSRPPPRGTSDCADPEASWGHRKNNLLRSEDELFYGYYLSAAIMMPEENGPAVPELARRATVSSCRRNPVRALAPVLTAMPAAGISPGGIPGDSGYAHRDADAWALPLRAAGAQLVQDLHPMTAAPRAPMKAPSSPTGTFTARAPPARCWNWGRSPAPPPASKPRTGNARPPNSPAAGPAGSPPTAQTATTGSSAPPPWARSAARCGPPRCGGTGTGPRSSGSRSTPRPAARSRRSPSRRT